MHRNVSQPLIGHLYDALGQDRLGRERFGSLREVAAKTLQERPGIIERIANRTCLAKLKRQRSFDHDAPDMLRVRARTDAQRGPGMKWIAGPGRFATAARSLRG